MINLSYVPSLYIYDRTRIDIPGGSHLWDRAMGFQTWICTKVVHGEVGMSYRPDQSRVYV